VIRAILLALEAAFWMPPSTPGKSAGDAKPPV
jgi:hypothetical protein